MMKALCHRISPARQSDAPGTTCMVQTKGMEFSVPTSRETVMWSAFNIAHWSRRRRGTRTVEYNGAGVEHEPIGRAK